MTLEWTVVKQYHTCIVPQVVIWDTSLEHERIEVMRNSRREDAGDDAASIPIVKPRFQSSIDYSHHRCITDLQWLPGVDVSLRGKITKLPEDSKDPCNFFATLAADGRINFWDMRVERLFKKGRAMDPLELVWKPIHSVHLLGTIGLDLGGVRACFNAKKLEGGSVYLGTREGELAHANVIRPEHTESPDYMQSIIMPHAGWVLLYFLMLLVKFCCTV